MADLWVDVDTAVIVPVNILPLLDDTDFKTIETAVVYNSAGLALTWNFQTCAGVVTGTAVTPTTAGNYDWSEPVADKGMYAIEIPASGGVSINNDTEGVGWFTGVATGVLPWRGPTIGFRRAALNDLLIDGGTASTNLEDFFDGTGYAGGTARLKADVDTIKTQAVTCAAGVTILASVGTASASTAQTGDCFPLVSTEVAEIYAAVITNAAGVDIAADIIAVKADTTAILVDTGTTLDGRIPAALTANGNMKCSLMEIISTALTETLGLLAGGFKKFFNVATPTGTVNAIPDAVAGAVGGIAIVGSEMAANVTKVNGAAQTATLDTIKIDTAAVLADTGTDGVVVAAASKTGYALSAAGVQAIWDALTSALNAVGSIGKKLADWVIGSLNADQSAVTVGTVTNLTNAPTNGDLTVAMKSSVTAAVPTAAAIADAVYDETATGHTDAGKAGAQIWTDIDAIAVDVAGLDGAAMRGTDSAALASVCTEARLAELDAANLPTDVAARATPAQVNAEVLDVLNVDTFAEPGQEAPAATNTLAKKIGYLFKAWRNRATQTASQYSLYNDDATTVDQKASFADDATTADRGEIATGP